MALKRRTLPPVFWTALVIAFAVAVWPNPVLLPGNPSDKLQHLAAFAGLAALAAMAYPRVRLPRIAIGLALYGALIEIVQSIPALRRSAELMDWMADIAGLALALAAAALIRRRRIRTGRNGASDGARTRDLRRDRPAL